MTLFYHQRLNLTRPTSPWLDELWLIGFEGVSVNGQLLPTASRGLFNFCISHAEALVCRLLGQLHHSQLHHQLEKHDGQMRSLNLAVVPNTPTMASDCDLIRSDARGRKRLKHTFSSRTFLAWRFQHNQGALPPVKFDRVCAARRKQSL